MSAAAGKAGRTATPKSRGKPPAAKPVKKKTTFRLRAI
jgi:hypothetical protein